ncbi:MAG TPA: sulfurtransferase TusA family protein [Actinomycetota bacterium]
MSMEMDTPPASAPPVDAPRVVDCLGLACPLPIVRLAKAIAEIEGGGVLDLLADDPGARVDIPVWCRLKDHTFLGRDDHPGGGWVFHIRRVH